MRVMLTKRFRQFPTRYSLYSCMLLRGLKKIFREISLKTALFITMKDL